MNVYLMQYRVRRSRRVHRKIVRAIDLDHAIRQLVDFLYASGYEDGWNLFAYRNLTEEEISDDKYAAIA